MALTCFYRLIRNPNAIHWNQPLREFLISWSFSAAAIKREVETKQSMFLCAPHSSFSGGPTVPAVRQPPAFLPGCRSQFLLSAALARRTRNRGAAFFSYFRFVFQRPLVIGWSGPFPIECCSFIGSDHAHVPYQPKMREKWKQKRCRESKEEEWRIGGEKERGKKC